MCVCVCVCVYKEREREREREREKNIHRINKCFSNTKDKAEEIIKVVL